MNKLLVAVDGSQHAQKALDIAASLARQHSASVIVFHASSDRGMASELRRGIEMEYADEIGQRLNSLAISAPLPDEQQYARTMLSHSDKVMRVVNTVAGEDIVKRATNRLRGNDVASVESMLVDGDPAEQIIEASENHNVDTIIMGCRGTGKLRGLVLGSVSQSVAHLP